MSNITYQTVLSVINNINSFAEQADRKIQQLWNDFGNSKRNLEEQYNRFMSSASSELEKNTAAIKTKAMLFKDSAEKTYQDVISLDAALAGVDKYYVKTRANKIQELGQRTESSISDEADIFTALEKVKEQFEQLSAKYSQDKLPALFDGINYVFSKQRKQDYEDLIVLKNTLEKLMDEVRTAIPELISDSTQIDQKNYDKKEAEIKKKYHTELDAVNTLYENNVEALADEICEQIDAILPDGVLQLLKKVNDSYSRMFSGINSNANNWDETIIVGYIDYPLELYVSSNILLSLIKDKCATILEQSGKLRFPLVFSLNGNMNILIKHKQGDNLKNQIVGSIMQSLVSSVPIPHLTFVVVDSENQGNSISSFASFGKKLPELFGGRIITAIDEIEDAIEKLSAYVNIDDMPLDLADNSIEDLPHEGQFVPDIKVLVILDSPKSLGEKNMASINTIIEKGGKRGVYTVIAYAPQENISPYNEKNCFVIKQENNSFHFFNLCMTYKKALEESGLAQFINNYSLLYDSIGGKVALLNAAGREVIANDSPEMLQVSVNAVKHMLDKNNDNYGNVPTIGHTFPSEVLIGSLNYPLGLISDPALSKALKSDLSAENSDSFYLPASVSLTDNSNLLLLSPEEIRHQTERLVHSLMWSFLSSLPVSKVNFCVFDAERRGNSITPFLDFRQKMPEVFDGQLYTSQDAMYTRLQKLNGYIDDFIQQKLGNRFDNIAEYNEKYSNRAEAVTLLVIFDFPRNFDNRSIELLLNILSNGGKCGIFTIICHNPDITFSRYESIDEHLGGIRRRCSIIEYIDKKFILRPYELTINTAPELSQTQVDMFIEQYNEAAEVLKRKGLDFEDTVKPPFFAASAADKLSIPVGIGDGDNVVKLELGGEGSSHHGIITGATGSGKSTLLHTIIMSGLLNHTPDELHLYLMDFKSGTEFKVYESVKLPHIRLLALDAMQEFGESILEDLVNEMTRRSDLFKSVGQTKLSGYVGSTGNPLPRILVVMDEFQILYNDSTNRKTANNCASLTHRLISEGRSYGINLLISTQTTKVISELTLQHGTIEQMRVRIGLKCGEDDARYLFGDRNDAKALEMMKGPIGTAVMNLEYMESNNIGFRAAYCSKEAQERYLQLISEKFADIPAATQVFEGNRTVMLIDHLNAIKAGMSDEPIIKIHMGTLIKVAPPFVMQFDRRRRHNLLICGANESMAENLTNLIIFSALLNTNSDVFCIDGESLIGESVSASLYSCFTDFTTRFKSAGSRAEIIGIVNNIFSAYKERKKSGELKQTIIVVKNMQFLDVVKKMFRGESIDESEYGGEATDDNSFGVSGFDFGVSDDYSTSSLSVTEKLLQIIDDGSSYGVFFVVSSLEYQSVKENMYYGENILAKFPERIVFSLSNNDADNLIDGVVVSGLRDNIVYYTDGVKATFQYKPYVMPTTVELKEFLENMQAGSDIA